MKKLIIIGMLSIAATIGAGAAINTSHATKEGISQTSPVSSKTIEVTTEEKVNKKKNKRFTISLNYDAQKKDVGTIVVFPNSKQLMVTIGNNAKSKILKNPFDLKKYTQILQNLINEAEASDVKENPGKYINKALEKLDNPEETTPPSAILKDPVPTEPTSSTSATEPTTRKVVQLKSNESGQIDIYLFDKDPNNDDDYDETPDDKICTLSFTDTEQKQCTVTFKDGTTKALTSTSAFNSDIFKEELQKLINESTTTDRNINEYIIKALTPNSSTPSTDEGKTRMIMLPTPGSSEENLQPKIPQMPSSNNPSIRLAPQVPSSQNFYTKVNDTTIECISDEKNPKFPIKLIIYTDQDPYINWCTNFNTIAPRTLIDTLWPFIQSDLQSNPIAFDVVINNLSLYIMKNPNHFNTEGFQQCIGDAVIECIPSTKPEFPLMLILYTKPDPNLLPLKYQGRLINPWSALKNLVDAMQKANSIHSSAFNAGITFLVKDGAPVLSILCPPYTFCKTIGDTTIQCNPSKIPTAPWQLTIYSNILNQSWKITFNIEPVNFLHYLIAYLESETFPQGLTKFEAAIYCAKRELGIRE